jgi:2-polyprenyl-3-methyl-5-hydroxy-6-metoxy-1,4-benzoquinol methylase
MTSMSLQERVARTGARALLATRRWSDRATVDVIGEGAGLRILEIGSGRQDLGKDAYSLAPALAHVGEFIQSDVNPEFGHRVVDVTNIELDSEFDVVLCNYVLEHVYDVTSAVAGLRRALKPGGRAIAAVPHIYPYHDEPIDFWRFTEHSLRMLFRDFSSVEIRHKGIRRFPKALLVIATR